MECPVLDLPLRARQPPLHRLGLDEERAGNLLGRQPAEGAERQRDLRFQRERRMTAGEDQLEPLIRKRPVVHLVLLSDRQVEQPRLLDEGAVAADAVERTVPGRGRQPCARVVRHTLPRPALRRDRERLLRRVLREVEVAAPTDQGREDAAPPVAEDVFERGYRSMIGRTSTAPPRRAAGMRWASAVAASRSSASNRKRPPRYSFASTKGPSLRKASPFSTRTVVADSAVWSWTPSRTPVSSAIASYSPIKDLI